MKKTTKTEQLSRDDIKRKWFIADANDKILGRFAGNVARVLTGKNKAEYMPNLDCGDYVIVINAEKVRTTGKKLIQKQYFRHSGYPHGMKLTHLEKMLAEHPDRVIIEAVKGMLPSTRLGRKMLKKMKVYKGQVHPHIAHKAEELKI